MKRIYVSTVGRGKEKQESSKIYCIDTDTEQIIAEVKLPLSMLDLANPRGGVRGARGLCFYDGSLFAAGFDGIFRIDEDLFIDKGIWSKYVRDIHQIYPSTTGGIIQVATFTNEIAHYNPYSGQHYYKRDYSNIHPGLPAPDWFPGCRDTLHINSVSEHYGLAAKAAIIFDLKTEEILLEDQELLKGSHDIWELPTGEVAINNSRMCRTITLNQFTWKLERTLYQETKTDGGSEYAKRGWTRGMFYLPEQDIMFIGSSPAEVIILENISGETKISKRIKISDEIVESIFDVIPHPEDWE